MSKTVAVLFGGRSTEHEISLRSAVYVLQNIPSSHKIIPVGITSEGAMWSLSGTFTAEQFKNVKPQDLGLLAQGQAMPSFSQTVQPTFLLPYRKQVCALPAYKMSQRVLNLEVEAVFPVLHGLFGEDGLIQAQCELAEVACVGCDTRASVIGIDKHLQKRLARDAGVPVVNYECTTQEEWKELESQVTERIVRQIGFPCFVKPNSLGSSVGIHKVKNVTELKTAVTDALRYDERILIEELMEGAEIECAFLGTPLHPQISLPGEITNENFYSFEEKYADTSQAQIYIPARIDPKATKEVQTLAAQLCDTFGLHGLCRLDFWQRKRDGKFFFNEINTLPGMTSISQFPQLWDHHGVKGPEWITKVLQWAEDRNKHRSSLNYQRT